MSKESKDRPGGTRDWHIDTDEECLANDGADYKTDKAKETRTDSRNQGRGASSIYGADVARNNARQQ